MLFITSKINTLQASLACSFIDLKVTILITFHTEFGTVLNVKVNRKSSYKDVPVSYFQTYPIYYAYA